MGAVVLYCIRSDTIRTICVGDDGFHYGRVVELLGIVELVSGGVVCGVEAADVLDSVTDGLPDDLHDSKPLSDDAPQLTKCFDCRLCFNDGRCIAWVSELHTVGT